MKQRSLFSDQMMAAAILDRFLHRATLLAINGVNRPGFTGGSDL
jgi:hypothetical protein